MAAAEGSNEEDRTRGRVRSGDNLSDSGPRGGEVFTSWGEGLTARGEGLMVLDRGERVRTLSGSTILWKLFTAAMETCGRKIINSLTTDDECTCHPNLVVCYQLVQECTRTGG